MAASDPVVDVAADEPAKDVEADKEVEVEKKDDQEEGDQIQEAEKEKEPEKPKELEEDAPSDSRPKVSADGIHFDPSDSTMNILAASGNVFNTLGEGGLQFLLGGMRGNAGVKSGRYMFEVRTLEAVSHDSGRGGEKPRIPKNFFRIGFSLKGSSLLLADKKDSVYFDSEGMFGQGTKRQKIPFKGPHFNKLGTFAVLLNRDDKTQNNGTISLFRDGVRVCQPKPIPEHLVGQPLFPTIAFKNMTLEVNVGPTALAPLEFKCRTIGDAAKEDLELLPRTNPANGKYEVVFPVGLPDKGFFEWVDNFLDQNPNYTELSDRKIIDWAVKSGYYRPKNNNSNDKPSMDFGSELLDNRSIMRTLYNFAPTQKRNFVIAELKENLTKADRVKGLQRFRSRNFKATAAVVMGTPDGDFKARVQARILAAKQSKADTEKRKEVMAAKRKRLAEEAKKKREAKKAKTEEGDAEEKKAEEEGDEDEEEEDPAVVTAPPVELTEEEKTVCFSKSAMPDVSEKTLNKCYADFALPETEEGFDDVKYHWDNESACTEALKGYIMERKLSQRVDTLQPGDWFKEKSTEWQKMLRDWKNRQGEWKDPNRRKMLLKKKIDAMKKAEQGDEPEKKEGEEDGEATEAKESKKEEETDIKLPEIKMDDLDVFAVDDVADVGSGEPLFSKFTFEDWALLSLRFELHLLMYAFRKDLDDPDRPTFPQGHLPFYYKKYFKKDFVISNYGFKEFSELGEIIKDTVEIKGERECLEPQLEEDVDNGKFVKLTEDHRRDRIRRVDAGDESALLKFVRPNQDGGKSRDGKGGKGGPRRDAPQRGGPPPRRDERSGPPPRRDAGVKRPWETHREPKGTAGGYRPREEPAWKRQNTGNAWRGDSGGYGRGPVGGRADAGRKGGKGGGWRR